MQNNSTWAPSVPSPISWPAKSWNVWLTIAVIIGALFVAFVPATVYAAIEVLSGHFDPLADVMAAKNINVSLTAQVLTYLPVALFFAALLPPLSKISLAGLGIRTPTLRTLGIGIAGTIVMMVVVTAVSIVVVAITHHQDTEAAIAMLKSLQTSGQKINFILVAVVLAPMVEELVFRVFIFNFFSRYLNIWVAMASSGLVFGMVHALGTKELASQLVTVGIPLSFGGFVLAYVYATTRNYWASVTTHVLFNTIGVVQVLYFHGS